MGFALLSCLMIRIHIIAHDSRAAADWYCAVLGAREEHHITLADGRLIDVELWFGDSKVVLADEFPEQGALSPKTTGASSAVFYLPTDDVDGLVEQAVAAGAEVIRPAADWFTGERDAQITDPFGHRWASRSMSATCPVTRSSVPPSKLSGALTPEPCPPTITGRPTVSAAHRTRAQNPST
jgi:PhnB protein